MKNLAKMFERYFRKSRFRPDAVFSILRMLGVNISLVLIPEWNTSDQKSDVNGYY